jgi:two-component system, chemotaxis family, sensor kinase CheA
MEIDDDLLVQTFAAESEENLVAIEQALITLERDPDDEEALRAIFRAAHTIKGNAATLGFRTVAEFAHLFEDVLDRLRKREIRFATAIASELLGAVDVIRQSIPGAIAGQTALSENAPAVAAALRQHVTGAPGAPAAAPAREPGGGSSAAAAGSHLGPELAARSLRVDVEKLDRMLRLAGEIAVARGRQRALLEASGQGGTEALEAHHETDRLFLDLQEQIMQARMVPVGPVFRRHERTVRDIALAHGKQAQLVVEGDDVEVDTAVVEHMRDPLTHMIRNALDHGLEPPGRRAAVGKPRAGRVTLRARRDAGSIVIEVADDGAGLDLDRIRRVAAERGIDTSRLREADLKALIFHPGFSTAPEVTDLSGRGVGMEVVRRNVELLRGTIAVDSEPGAGTTVSIRLPLTLAIIDGFSVGVGEETYVVPLDAVVECLELPPEAGGRKAGCGIIDVRGAALPFLRLRELFDLPAAAPGRENVVVVRQAGELGGQLAGIAVDALFGRSQTVIKPLGQMFRGVPGVAGSTIQGSGRIALILDVPALLREATARHANGTSLGPREATA